MAGKMPELSLENDNADAAVKILIADDEDIVRMVLTEMLQQLGYHPVTASGAQEAVDAYRDMAAEISLVILDYKMPGLSGDEVFARLREMNPEVKVLISSGYSDGASMDELKRQGLSGYLQKPFSMDRIREELERILGDQAA